MKHKLCLSLLLFSASCFALDDTEDIARLLGATFDKPDAPLTAQPIVVVEDYAIADWVQGTRGGRALLVKRDNQWKIALCGGRTLSDKETLKSADIPEQQAAALARKLAEAERLAWIKKKSGYSIHSRANWRIKTAC